MDIFNIDLSKIIDFGRLGKLFLYDERNPLLFNSGLFFFIFTGFLLLYRLLKHHESLRIIYVILFSFYFYYKSSGVYVLTLLAVGIWDYCIGMGLGRTENRVLKRLLVLLSISANLGMLCYFKYTNLIFETIANIRQQDFDPFNIVLPIGISFFTFRSLSYIIDVYRKEMDPLTSLRDYIFFLSFFPPLVAGPVVRAKDFVPQIHRPLEITPEMMGEGLFLVITGLIKKVVISDYISGNFVDRIFDNPLLYSGFENLMGVYGYTLQIYCDFSGYSDMAIGLALLMGFRFKINFDSPYKSASITEFWRRWHISLSNWLRDYLYIPMGGSRVPRWRIYVNLFITMVIGGLWHGASWLFIIWGAWHGFLLVIHKFFRHIFPENKNKPAGKFRHFINVFFTFNLICIGWVFFRAPSLEVAGQIFTQIFTNFHPEIIPAFVDGYLLIVVTMLIGFILHFTPHKYSLRIQKGLEWLPLAGKAFVFAIVIFLVLQVRSSELVPFIDFQF